MCKRSCCGRWMFEILGRALSLERASRFAPVLLLCLTPSESPLLDSRHCLHLWWALGNQQAVKLAPIQLAGIQLISVSLTLVDDTC